MKVVHSKFGEEVMSYLNGSWIGPAAATHQRLTVTVRSSKHDRSSSLFLIFLIFECFL